jgi:general secretion pathway protein A
MPAAVPAAIRSGDRGPAVAWLRGQLAQLQGGEVVAREEAANQEPVFDEALLRQVKRFQLNHGLVPDGSVGPETLIRLASAVDRTAPRLSRGQGDK